MERRFELIDGNMVKHYKLSGYCISKQGGLTDALIQTHRCKKKDSGKPCPKLILFNYSDGFSKVVRHS